MFECGVGVSTESTYVVNRINSGFFEREGRSNTTPEYPIVAEERKGNGKEFHG
jgi:hypothetical protein